MLTFLVHVTAKVGKEREFHDLIVCWTKITRAEDDGCLTYIYLQQQEVYPPQYVLYEQWRDQQALDAHLAHLQNLLGSPPPNGGLPAAFLDLCEITRVEGFDVVI